jgi:mannose-6-phosphate isomerase-like protein (cupin superfamily)
MKPVSPGEGSSPGKVVSREHPLKHYVWGAGCDGWTMVDQPGLSVKLEKMPPHTSEEAHYHEFSRQFFFILKGTASFETDEGKFEVTAQQGLEIPPLLRHRIINDTEEDLEFILSSQPSTAGDRVNISNENI